MSSVVPNLRKNKNEYIKETVSASSSGVSQIKFNQYIDTISIIVESSRLSGKPALFCLGDQSLYDMLEV
ncbi:hypothetical protein [Candidatus Williamhamiltonella defendens]|uniref:hypothetical protein n=1 Tax=Candidatus Williamhamiltonella defendens TaxID=138072 RepID=UPI001F414DEA|nr:hypothetical protein [Candidatus Hamiltonella defensa]